MYKFLLILLLGQCWLHGQSVDVFIQMTKSYDPGLEAMKLEYQAALQKADQVGDWPDPTVNLALGVLPVETRLGAQRFRVGVTQMIPWKGTLDAQKDVALASAEVKSQLDEVREITLEFMIRTTYARLTYLDAQKIIIRERLEVLEAMLELAKSGVRSGKSPLSNVLLTERRREALEADLNLLDKQMEQPIITLNRWAGRPFNAEITIEDRLNAPIFYTGIEEEVLKQHPQFSVLDRQIEASEAVIKNTAYQSKPQIGVGIDYAYVTKRRDVEMPGNGRDILMPMGSIKVPIFTKRYESIRKEEAIKQDVIAAKRRDYLIEFQAEVELALSKIEYAEAQVRKFESLKVITLETLDLMRAEYAAEETRFEELLRMEMELLDYDLQILNANYEKELAQAVFEKYR
ncbi:TolC family protein [Portibacter marinus]|uniref:TolC family protein n=1 Tax=Portibacter marinus TaxID=2898660 RepID=UPI001F36F36F|nr:TolC family protein [Portibacter marinus]